MSFLLNANLNRTSADVAVIDERSLATAADRANAAHQVDAAPTVWADLRRYLRYGGVDEVITPPLPIRAADAEPVCAALAVDSLRVVAEVLAVAHGTPPLRMEPSLLTLALAASAPDDVTRQAALLAFRRVARTGRNLFLFATFVQGQRGWGRGLRRAIGAWYNDRPLAELANIVLRDPAWAGWRHADLLRLGHPKAASAAHDALYRWLLTGTAPDVVCSTADSAALARLRAVTALRDGVAPNEAARLIVEHRLPLTCMPPPLRAEAAVWPALIGSLDLDELAEQLGAMRAAGALVAGSAFLPAVVEQLHSDAPADPVRLAAALRAYVHGASGRTWCDPVATVVAAWEHAITRRAALADRLEYPVRITVAAEAIGEKAEGSRADLAALLALSIARTGGEVSLTVVGADEIAVRVSAEPSFVEVQAGLRGASAAAGASGLAAPLWLSISPIQSRHDQSATVGFAADAPISGPAGADVIVRGTGEGVLRLLPDVLRS